MAKPLVDSEVTVPSSECDTNTQSTEIPQPGSRKRARNLESTDCEETVLPCDPDENHKTRRVNPHRLAARLAPELVAEMEAYIVPGAKMPNFTIRKDFQERYSVDRRHIYDYFHSRGLRVAKEDRHTNLTRGRASAASRRPIQPTTKDLVKHEARDNILPKPGVALTSPPKLSPERANHQIHAEVSLVKLQGRRGIAKKPVSDVTPTVASPEYSYSFADDEDSNYDTPASPCPEFTLPEEYPDTPVLDEYLHGVSIFDPSSDLGDLYEITNDLSMESLLLDYHPPDSLVSIEEPRLLTKDERNEFYNLINNSINTSNGLQECSGTYSAYMKEQSQRYYDRLVSKPPYGTARPDKPSPMTDSLGEVDFQKWLSVIPVPVEQSRVEPGDNLKKNPLTTSMVTCQGQLSAAISSDGGHNLTSPLDLHYPGNLDRSVTPPLVDLLKLQAKVKGYRYRLSNFSVRADGKTVHAVDEGSYNHAYASGLMSNTVPIRLRTTSAGGGI